jgi:hypothetical protein
MRIGDEDGAVMADAAAGFLRLAAVPRLGRTAQRFAQQGLVGFS